MPSIPISLAHVLLLLFFMSTAEAFNPKQAIVVVFGRPGSGKTTIAEKALSLLDPNTEDGDESKDCIQCLGLDLDVCIPQWMKDNFGKGIYPTLAERREFAKTCCDYVEEACSLEEQQSAAAVVSFSFVNTDLRDVFRQRFPTAAWVLVDTSEEEANVRIQQREGHFYGGKPEENEASKGEEEDDNQKPKDDDDDENSEWNFAPVEFPHDILDGTQPVEANAKIVADVVRRAVAAKENAS